MSSVLEAFSGRSGWERHPFGRLVSRSKECGRPDLEPLSVFLGEGVVPRSSREDNHNRLGEDMSKYLVVRPNDLVFNKLRTWQGGFGVSRYEGVVSPAYFVCRPTPSVDPRFLHHLLRSQPYLAELTRVSKFMPPSQFDIVWDDLRMVPVLLPPLGEQRAIADYLDTETARIDALIAKKRDLLATSRERRRASLLHDIAEMRTLSVPLKRVARLIDCKHRTAEYVEDGYPVVSPGDVEAGPLDLSRCHRFVSHDDWRDLADGDRRPRRGDIIYSRNASVGLAGLVTTDDDFCMGQDVCIVRPNRADGDGRFLSFVLNTSGLDQIEAIKVGSTFFRINVAQIAELQVPGLPEREQDACVSRWELESRRTATIERRLAKQVALLVEHRQALITAAVTGELEVPGAAA